ncbi:FMN-binding negative transcriptional regulator [Vibrio nereis]|uniref:Transcriptional regulator n=1 Tax=Vibrio nereis TaxID=693 RepID=A0A0M0HQV3_VIBNE|nr:FMN-binding negative transcriptional regulator [Vibrio nereis]KOO04475.1 transcriptional regulator [Vibrio nereis]
MYIPRKFRQENIEQLVALMQQYPFATLVTHSNEGIDATHLPVMFKQVGERFVLKAHIAKANSLWKEVLSGSEVLVIFNGPNCYISPNHYPTKAEHGKAVPTWNYAVAHVKGTISFIHDPDWIHTAIEELTAEHESQSMKPWSMSDAPDEFIQKLLLAVVGVEIEISSITGQWKLSQNQPDVNKQGVIEGLSSLGDPASQSVASMVREQTK